MPDKSLRLFTDDFSGKAQDRSYVLYGLFDPDDAAHCRYVGYSRRPDRRFKQHLQEAMRGHPSYKARWIRKLIAQGRSPALQILRYVESQSEAAFIEQAYIRGMKLSGHHLTNGTEGGDGGIPTARTVAEHSAAMRTLSVRKPEVRARMTAALHTPEARERLRMAMQRPDVRVKMAAINRGRKHTAAFRARLSAIQKQRWTRGLTAEQRARRSAATKKWWADRKLNHPAEFAASCQKLSESKKGRKLHYTEASRAAMRAKRALVHRSPELRARQSAYKKAWWAAHKVEMAK